MAGQVRGVMPAGFEEQGGRMRTRVKFCGLVRPEDVDVAVALGVDAVGFVFYPRSARYLEPEAAAVLRRRLPSWVRAVGLFVNAGVDEMRAVADAVGLDVIQAHGDETPQDLATLNRPWWKALRIGVPGGHASPGQGRVQADAQAVREAIGLFSAAECCLADSASTGFGGSGQAFDWSVLPRGGAQRLVLAGGLRPDTVGEAIRQLSPFAVDVSSGIQGADPRTKDTVRMEAFMAAVLRADADRQEACAVDTDRNRR